MTSQAQAALPDDDDPRRAHARALLAHIESGNHTEADRVLDELTRLRETALFQELGKLTRDLHDALNAFRLDTRLSDLTTVDIPDAKERLHYVISMTDQAANRTLSAIEESTPICEQLRERAGQLHASWERFMRRDMQAEEFRALARQMHEFLPWVEGSAQTVQHNISEILMAQSFQDLTGQIIKRVIGLVEEVEQNLVNLIRLSGQKAPHDPNAAAAERKDVLEGPQIAGKESSDAVTNQDDVDALLSSLGF